MHIVKELADNLEHYINQHYDNIAPIGQYEKLDRERELELDLVKRAREWLKDQEKLCSTLCHPEEHF